MIKTHKPRGHLWTCPSLFQQSTEIRNIRFEDCTPPPVKTLVKDSDDELQPKQRAAKRRRIERLADDFLNGQPLLISCVRPHPSTLRGAIEGVERSRTGAKYVLPEVEVSDDDGELWRNVESIYDMPKDVGKAKKTGVRGVLKQPTAQRKESTTATETITEEHATSACKPVRRVVKAVVVTLDPSAEAIKQAAALRARSLLRAATDVPKLPLLATADTVEDSDNAAEPRSETDAMPPRSVRDRKARGTEWLLRRHTTLCELNADESLDELSRSRLDTPSRPSQVPITQLPAPSPSALEANAGEPASTDGSTSMNLTQSDGRIVNSNKSAGRVSIGSYKEHWERFAGTAAPDAVTERQDHTGSYHTAPEETELAAGGNAAHNDLDADSQTRFLRSQGINVAPRKVWTSTNGTAPPQQPADRDHGDNAESVGSSNASALRASVQESATHVGKTKKSKRGKSAGHEQTPHDTATVTRRRSAPSESQNAATQMESLPLDQRRHMGAFRAYTDAEDGKADETPFMFRKRTSKGSRADSREGTVVGVSTRQRRPMKFLSSQDETERTAAQTAPIATPRLDVSIGNDSFGKKLNLALTEEHLNGLLPADPETASALRRSLRQEWQGQDEDVEITRIEDEPAFSQVAGPAAARRLSREALHEVLLRDNAGDAPIAGEEEISAEPAQTQWPGTQALLSKAHADFFSSPVKGSPRQAADILGSTTPASDPAPNTTNREPLRTLSQEPVPQPSTQAMQEAWSPWSTVKKPKCDSARVAMGRQPAAQASTVRANSVGDASKRRSSLRFSTSITIDSPTAHLADATTTRGSALRLSTSSTTDSPTAEGGTRRGSGLRFSTSASMSSPAKGTLPFTAVTKSVSRSQPQDKGLFDEATVTPKSILRKRGGSQRSSALGGDQERDQIDGERTVMYDLTTVVSGSTPTVLNVAADVSTMMPGSAPAVMDAAGDAGNESQMSNCPFDRTLLMVRDDSNVDQTIDEMASFLDMTDIDAVF